MQWLISFLKRFHEDNNDFKKQEDNRAWRYLTTVLDTFYFLIFPCVHRALTMRSGFANCAFTCAFRSASFVLTVNRAITVHSLRVDLALTVRSDYTYSSIRFNSFLFGTPK